jgi:hypothetical protein
MLGFYEKRGSGSPRDGRNVSVIPSRTGQGRDSREMAGAFWVGFSGIFWEIRGPFRAGRRKFPKKNWTLNISGHNV